eukprot:jgi/Picsp_1/3690/NSC_06527-R1_histone deacetylase family protein
MMMHKGLRLLAGLQTMSRSTVTQRSMPLPIVYHPLYSAPKLRDGHQFPMGVFEKIFEVLVADKMISQSQIHVPDFLADKRLLNLVHCEDYVERFLERALDPSMVRRIGFGDAMQTQELVDRTLAEVSGTLKTAELALKHGLALNTAGGTHHAFRAHGSGYCILNDLAITSEYLLSSGLAKKVLVLDLDVHQGDGTASIFESRIEVFCLSMHARNNFPVRKQKSHLDIELEDGCSDDQYLGILSEILPRVLRDFQPSIVLYDAGVDVHFDDDLGKLSLTDDGLLRREFMVLDTCLGHDIPVAGFVGGGYHKNLFVLARRHALLHQAALELWDLYSLG